MAQATIQDQIRSLTFPKSMIRRTQPRDQVDHFHTKTWDGKTLDLDVYERRGDKWYVITTYGVIGWTRDAVAAFDVFNAAEFFTLGDLQEMVK